MMAQNNNNKVNLMSEALWNVTILFIGSLNVDDKLAQSLLIISEEN